MSKNKPYGVKRALKIRRTKQYMKRLGLRGKVNKIAKIVRTLKPEINHLDISLAGTIDYNGSLTNMLTTISQGIQEGQHIGSDIRLKNLYLNFAIQAGTNSSFFNNTLRFMIIMGKLENATSLNIANILYNTGTNTAPYSLSTYDQRRKYKVLFDRTYQLSTGYVTAIYSGSGAANINPGYKNIAHVRKNIPLKDILVKYNLNTTTILNHGLYYLAISDVSASGPTILGYARLTYTDS